MTGHRAGMGTAAGAGRPPAASPRRSAASGRGMKAIADHQLELPFPVAGGPETATRAAGGVFHAPLLVARLVGLYVDPRVPAAQPPVPLPSGYRAPAGVADVRLLCRHRLAAVLVDEPLKRIRDEPGAVVITLPTVRYRPDYLLLVGNLLAHELMHAINPLCPHADTIYTLASDPADYRTVLLSDTSTFLVSGTQHGHSIEDEITRIARCGPILAFTLGPHCEQTRRA